MEKIVAGQTLTKKAAGYKLVKVHRIFVVKWKKGNGMNISLEYYKVFYYAAKFGNITAAAEQLCISQPAVSQAIGQLEQALGAKLFLRLSKGVRLTREGELLYRYVQEGMDTIWQGETMLKRMQDLDTGEVRIGASDMTLQFYLLPYLERFHELFPKVKVTVSNGPTPETLKFLSHGTIDFGVVSSPFEAKPEVKVTEVRKIRDCFVAGEQFAPLKDTLLDYEILQRMPCIFLEKNTSTRKFMDQFLEDRQVEVEPEFELSTSDMIVQFALRNLGIGCVMEDFAKTAIDSGKLFELTFQEPMPERGFCIISNNHSPVSPAGQKLLQLLLGEQGLK